MPNVNVKFLDKKASALGNYTFADSTDDDKSIDLSTVTPTNKLGAKLAVLTSSSGLTKMHILADIDKFQFNIRNILITKYPSLSGGTGILDCSGATGHIPTSYAGGPLSYLKTDCGITTGRYIAKGMENWIPTNDEGNRLIDGNLPLQLDISKGWVSILGKDKNGEFGATVERGKINTGEAAYEKPAPGTYNHIAVVVNKWHKIGMEMYIGDSGAGNTAQKLVTSGDLARENLYGVFDENSGTPSEPWGTTANQKYTDAKKGTSEYTRYKYRIGQKLEKRSTKIGVGQGITMANNHFSNRNFNGESRMYWNLDGGGPSAGTTNAGKLLITNTAVAASTASKKLAVGDCVIFMDSFKGAGLLNNQAMASTTATLTSATAAAAGVLDGLASTTTSGTGSGATFDVVIGSVGSVTSVTTRAQGSGYSVGDKLTISNTIIPGTSVDLVITLVTADFGARGGSIPNNSTIKHGGTYYVVDDTSLAIGLATTKGGAVINAGNAKGKNTDYLIKHSGFRKELETYPTGNKDVGCMFLAREKFNWHKTNAVTIAGGLTFSAAHEIPYGTAVEYTDNGKTNIPQLVSGNKYFVVGAGEVGTTAHKAKHVLLSLTKNGTPIPIINGKGATGNKLRLTRPLAYDEVHWLREDEDSSTVWANSQHNSTDKLANMSYEPLVLVKKLNPPLVITKKTRDIKFTWKMGGAGRLNLWREDLGQTDWTTGLDGALVSGKGAGRGEQGVLLNINELNFSVKAI